jgi:hypothetical protein
VRAQETETAAKTSPNVLLSPSSGHPRSVSTPASSCPSPRSRRPGVQPVRPAASSQRGQHGAQPTRPATCSQCGQRGSPARRLSAASRCCQPNVAARRGSPPRMPRRHFPARARSLRGGVVQPRHRHADHAPPCTDIVIKRRDAASLRNTFAVRPSLTIVELVDAFALSPSRREPRHVHLMVVCRGGEISTPIYPLHASAPHVRFTLYSRDVHAHCRASLVCVAHAVSCVVTRVIKLFRACRMLCSFVYHVSHPHNVRACCARVVVRASYDLRALIESLRHT